MSQVSKNVLGADLLDGSAFFVRESAQSGSGAAAITAVTLQTSKFFGAQARREYLMPQMNQFSWALRAFENRVPDCELLFEQAKQTPDPAHAIELVDQLLELAAGSIAAPTMRVIPGYALMQNAYKTSEAVQTGLLGLYDASNYGFTRIKPRDRVVSVLPKPMSASDLRYAARYVAGTVTRSMTADDLDAVSDAVKLDQQFRRYSISAVGDQLSDDDARSLARTLGFYYEPPAWMQGREVVADPDTGCVLFNGVALTDAALTAPFFPRGARRRGGGRTLASWAAAHNAAMMERPRYADIRTATYDEFSDIAQLQASGRQGVPIVERLIDGHTRVIPFDEVYPRLFGGGNNHVYALTFNGVTEYMAFAPGAYSRHQQRRQAAIQVWQNAHGGIARNNGGYQTAREIVAERSSLANRDVIVPGFVRALTRVRDALSYSTVPLLNDLRNALVGIDNVHDLAALTAAMNAVHDALQPIRPKLPKVEDLTDKDIADSIMSQGYTIIATGRYAPTVGSVTALVPVKGRGITPIDFVRTPAGELIANERLKVAVVLEEPPASVFSPVKTMIATALLSRLIGYLNGKETPAGYNFDQYDANNPYGVGQGRPCPRVLLNRQIDRYEQALVTEIENATVEKMPEILNVAQQLVDAKYFLNHVDEVVAAIMDREDWIYMLQALVLGLIVQDGAEITDSDGNDVKSLYPGIVPRQAAQFLFGTVLADIVPTSDYQKVVQRALSYGVGAPIELREQAEMDRVIRAEVLFARAQNGLKLLESLLDATNPLVSNIHASGKIQSLIDADLALELVQALGRVFSRDYLALVNRIEYEAPWDCAEWATSFGAFAFSVESTPISYDIVNVAAEIARDSGLTSLSSAIARVGFNWFEIAPSALRVRGRDQNAVLVLEGAIMAGQPVPVGPNGNPVSGATELFNDAPVSSQALKITTVCPSYDIEAYNLVKAYLTMNTSRTYFAQVVGKDVADCYRIRLPISVSQQDALLAHVLGQEVTELRNLLHSVNGLCIEKTPALDRVALLMPYVSSYLTKPAITRDLAVPQIISIDADRSLAVVSGVTIVTPGAEDREVISPVNGLAVTTTEKRSVSTALPWVGA